MAIFGQPQARSTTTSKKGGLSSDPQRVFDKTILTAQRT